MRNIYKHIDIDFNGMVEIINTQGRTEAEKFIQDNYNMPFYLAIKRLREESIYKFNRSTGKYEVKASGDEQFLTLDELSSNADKDVSLNVNKSGISFSNAPVSADFEGILMDMVKDRLLEVSKYIRLEQSRMKITILLQELKRSGYDVLVL